MEDNKKSEEMGGDANNLMWYNTHFLSNLGALPQAMVLKPYRLIVSCRMLRLKA